jgi:hypothetical protein
MFLRFDDLAPSCKLVILVLVNSPTMYVSVVISLHRSSTIIRSPGSSRVTGGSSGVTIVCRRPVSLFGRIRMPIQSGPDWSAVDILMYVGISKEKKKKRNGFPFISLDVFMFAMGEEILHGYILLLEFTLDVFTSCTCTS